MVLSLREILAEHAASAELESVEPWVPRVELGVHGLLQSTVFASNHSHTGMPFSDDRSVEAMSNETPITQVRSASYGPCSWGRGASFNEDSSRKHAQSAVSMASLE